MRHRDSPAVADDRPARTRRSPGRPDLRAVPTVPATADRPVLDRRRRRSDPDADHEGLDPDVALEFERLTEREVERRLREGLDRTLAEHTRDAVLADRERIAMDLHDRFIQSLYAAGMQLHAMAGRIRDPKEAERLLAVVDLLDNGIEELRRTIFSLQQPMAAERGVSEALTGAVQDAVAMLGFAPTLEIEGDPDRVHEDVARHLLAVLQESLSNAARHAGASAVSVRVTVSRDAVSLTVIDDGVGIPAVLSRSSGTANVAQRAMVLGGVSELTRVSPSGTRLFWQVPLSQD